MVFGLLCRLILKSHTVNLLDIERHRLRPLQIDLQILQVSAHIDIRDAVDGDREMPVPIILTHIDMRVRLRSQFLSMAGDHRHHQQHDDFNRKS